MKLYFRFIRSAFLLGRIFLSYMGHQTLVLLFQKKKKDSPLWLDKRRKKIDEINADRLLHYFHSVGGMFIKLGQVLAMLEGPLPKVFSQKLSRLHDQMPPTPFLVIEKEFQKAWGKDYQTRFSSIDQTPLASASFGQVHSGMLKDGRKVAIKVLYPNLRNIIQVDLKIVKIIMPIYNVFVPAENLAEEVFRNLSDMVTNETHFLKEAENIKRFANLTHDEPDIVVPEIIDDLSNDEILVMTFIEGIKITDVDTLHQHRVDTEKLASRTIELFFKSIFEYGWVHADPHPGNFLIQPTSHPQKPNIAVLDFGALRQVHPHTQEGLKWVFVGLALKNVPSVIKGLEHIGFVREQKDPDFFRETIQKILIESLKKDPPTMQEMIARKEINKGMTDKEALLTTQDQKRLLKTMRYPENWFYVERAAVMTFWLIAKIHPTIKLLEVMTPHLMTLLLNDHRANHRAHSSTTESI